MTIQLTDRTRLILTAALVAIAIMAAIILAVVFVPARFLERLSGSGKWVRFGLVTTGLVVLSLKSYWTSRKSLGFWFIFLTFLGIHFAGVGHLFSVRAPSTLALAAICGIEMGCMALVIYWVLGVGPDLRSGRSRSPWIPTL